MTLYKMKPLPCDPQRIKGMLGGSLSQGGADFL
jgi:hypothetical protein